MITKTEQLHFSKHSLDDVRIVKLESSAVATSVMLSTDKHLMIIKQIQRRQRYLRSIEYNE